MDAFDKIREAARNLALAATGYVHEDVVRKAYDELRLAIDDAAGGDEPWDGMPAFTPAPARADLGKFELSAYHVGITRHEVAAAALDRIMARDFDMWDGLPSAAVHAKNAATEAWAYANALFEVEHTTEEQHLVGGGGL